MRLWVTKWSFRNKIGHLTSPTKIRNINSLKKTRRFLVKSSFKWIILAVSNGLNLIPNKIAGNLFHSNRWARSDDNPVGPLLYQVSKNVWIGSINSNKFWNTVNIHPPQVTIMLKQNIPNIPEHCFRSSLPLCVSHISLCIRVMFDHKALLTCVPC